MFEWNWATILTITGAVLEVSGLGFVFAELAFIRSHEFGTLPPWERARHRLQRLFRRPTMAESIVPGGATASGAPIRGVARPLNLSREATDRERIERLESYVEHIDKDLSGLWNTMREYRDAAIEEAKRRDATMQQEIEQREEDRKAKLKPSLTRQKYGAVLVFAGLAIGTVGSMI